MGNYARLLNYLPKVTALVAVVENTALLKGMKATRYQATENGVALQRSRSAKRRAHDSSFSISIDVARL